MSKEELFSYLKERSLQEWFNPNAPKIKNGQIDPKDFSQEEALSLLLREPILIRRPLMSVHGHRMCGFDHKEIENVLGVPLQDRFQESCTLSNQCLTPISPATP